MAARTNDLAADAGPFELTDPLTPPSRPDTSKDRRRSALAGAWSEARDRATVRRLLIVGLPVLGVLMLLTASDAGGQVVLWENAHWTVAGLLAAAVAASAAHRSRGVERRLRGLVALGAASWAVGQLCWDLQTAMAYFSVPAPSDIGYLFLVVPVIVALALAVHGRTPRAEEYAVYLDATAIFLAITAVILAAYGDQLAGLGLLAAGVTVAYPILHLATAGAGLVSLLATRAAVRLSGGYLLLVGFAMLGFAWVEWLRQALVALPPAGSVVNYVFSVGIVCVGIGAAGWRFEDSSDGTSRRATTIVHGALPLTALIGSAALIIVRHASTPEIGLVDLAALGAILLAGVRQTLLVHERGRLLDDSGRAREELEEALVQRAAADSRYQVLVERVPAAVYIDVADPDVSDGGRLAYMSPQIESILGYPAEAFLADPELWPGLIHPDDRKAAFAAYHEHWATDRPLRADYRMHARDGSLVWVHDEAYSMTEGPAGGRRVSQGLLVDTTDQKRLEEQLLHDALHDPLTGLANRVLFRDHVERALAGRRRRGTKVALLFVDLDDFKVVNDSLGHKAGDRLLIEVANRLTAVIRAGDIAARQGGDEFTVLLDLVRSVDDAVASAERIATELRRPIELEGRSIVITLSVGIALATDAETDADDLLAHADAAMYAAKGQGKARYAVFDPAMRVRARSRLQMEVELRTAIDQEALELHYQPIVELASNRIVGFEALVRWRHAEHGLILPNAFIPLAEATGLIVPLGRLVTRSACRELRAWIDNGSCRGDLTVSVNVSPRQAVEPGFAAEVAEILATTSLQPSSLILEITESLMLHESVASGSLRQLHEMGVQLVVDDFGTGFSALEYFKRFAVQGLKIDRSFIAGLGRSREDTAIVSATLAFASALGLSVTAEGVETTDQLDRLRALGCQQAQGYLFARPVPAAEVPGLLEGAVALALLSRAS
ncbi:MAG: EAL domain-containing protein [Candidatus Limnocylindrales bacterium]|nr:EAL domain-containing protein [Candidatus Limnocylindrales bacterium]